MAWFSGNSPKVVVEVGGKAAYPGCVRASNRAARAGRHPGSTARGWWCRPTTADPVLAGDRDDLHMTRNARPTDWWESCNGLVRGLVVALLLLVPRAAVAAISVGQTVDVPWMKDVHAFYFAGVSAAVLANGSFAIAGTLVFQSTPQEYAKDLYRALQPPEWSLRAAGCRRRGEYRGSVDGVERHRARSRDVEDRDDWSVGGDLQQRGPSESDQGEPMIGLRPPAPVLLGAVAVLDGGPPTAQLTSARGGGRLRTTQGWRSRTLTTATSRNSSPGVKTRRPETALCRRSAMPAGDRRP
jgi:hypothetical protein